MKRLVMTVLAGGLIAVSLGSTSAPSAASPTRPLSAFCQTAVQPGATILVTGSCHITHLGLAQVESSHGVIPAGPMVDGVLPIALVDGRGTYVAANGDKLYFAYSGLGTLAPATGHAVFHGATSYTGGTGRVAGAAGSASFHGQATGSSGWVQETGTLEY
jgi:hypothetical protein